MLGRRVANTLQQKQQHSDPRPRRAWLEMQLFGRDDTLRGTSADKTEPVVTVVTGLSYSLCALRNPASLGPPDCGKTALGIRKYLEQEAAVIWKMKDYECESLSKALNLPRRSLLAQWVLGRFKEIAEPDFDAANASLEDRQAFEAFVRALRAWNHGANNARGSC